MEEGKLKLTFKHRWKGANQRDIKVLQHPSRGRDPRADGRKILQSTSHDLRRTVATRLAEKLGDQGDKLVKRVLGHTDGSVTAIYNRYAYVREMRRLLKIWANDLTARPTPLQNPSAQTDISQAA
jgi:integrase